MKKNVSPGLAIVIILVFVAGGALYYYRFMQFTLHAPGPVPGRKQPPPPKGMINAFAAKQAARGQAKEKQATKEHTPSQKAETKNAKAPMGAKGPGA